MLRRILDLTQQEFADRLGIRQNTVTKYETGRGTPTRSVIALICREFRVNENWLRTGSGEMFLPPPRDELDELVEKYELPGVFRSLIDKFLDLRPDQREAVIEYVRKVAADFMAQEADEPVDQHAIWEAEARAEAERVYQEILQEKKAAAESSAFPPGGGLLA